MTDSSNALDAATPFTNVVLLDLYMCAVADKPPSIPARLLALLSALGFITTGTVDRASEATWYAKGKKLHAQCVMKSAALPKGVTKQAMLSRLAAQHRKSLDSVTPLPF